MFVVFKLKDGFKVKEQDVLLFSYQEPVVVWGDMPEFILDDISRVYRMDSGRLVQVWPEENVGK